jgi:ABC-type enterochelin transport system substrate-binding protein
MSIINLVGTLLTPDYPTLFQTSPEVMVEAARREGARLEGSVGTIVMDTHECTFSGDSSCFCFKGVKD